MTFQCAKISVVLDPSLTAEGGALAWTTTRSTYFDRMPACSNWKTASTQPLQNELGTLSQSGTPGSDPQADPMNFPRPVYLRGDNTRGLAAEPGIQLHPAKGLRHRGRLHAVLLPHV